MADERAGADDRVIVGDAIFEGGPGKTWSPEDFQIYLLEIVLTESGPLAIALSPNPAGEGRVRGCPCKYKYAILYVSRGIGTTFTPVRLNAPPEVTLFKLI